MNNIRAKLLSVTSYGVIAVMSLQTLFFVVFQPVMASAAGMTQTMVRFDRMKTSTFTSGTVCAKSPTAATATETSVKVTFPTGYTVSTTTPATTWAVDTTVTTGWPAGGTAWTGISAPTGAGEFLVTGQAVNFVSGNLASATILYCFNWTNNTTALQTSASATANNSGTVITQITGGTASDTGAYATSTIANDTITVNATVPATFSLALGATTDNFTGNLSTSAAVATTGVGITIVTNAPLGWTTWVKNLNASSGAATKGALKSATASNFTIPTTNSNALASASHATINNTQDYGLGSVITTDFAGGGTVALDAAYNGAGGNIGVLDPLVFRTLATSGGTAGGDVVTITERATIDGTVPPATDYTDQITVVGAGNF